MKTILLFAALLPFALHADPINLDPGSNVTYEADGQIVGDFYGTLSTIPLGETSASFAVPNSTDTVNVNLLSYQDGGTILDELLGVDGLTGFLQGDQTTVVNSIYSDTQWMAQDISVSDVDGVLSWSDQWSVNLDPGQTVPDPPTQTFYAGAVNVPDAPNTLILLGMAVCGLWFLANRALKKPVRPIVPSSSKWWAVAYSIPPSFLIALLIFRMKTKSALLLAFVALIVLSPMALMADAPKPTATPPPDSAQVTTLKGQVADLTAKLAEAQAEFNKLARDYTAAQNNVESASIQLDAAQRQIQALQQQLAAQTGTKGKP
jgi:hypothetical protein